MPIILGKETMADEESFVDFTINFLFFTSPT
jgi:hypothetical protein